MGEGVIIEIDMNKKCSQCGEPGATQNGLCMECVGKAMVKGWQAMAVVQTVFQLGDVHPKAKVNEEGEIERTLTLKLTQADYSEEDIHALVDMLGERVLVSIAVEQPKIPGT